VKLLAVVVISITLSACGKNAVPQLSEKDAFEQCTSNQVLGRQLGPGNFSDEAMFKVINACMERHHFKCERTSDNEPCDWSAAK
jgi:hypothetical protein